MIDEYQIQIIETVVVVFSYLIIRFAVDKAIEKVSTKFAYQKARAKIMKKFVHFFMLFISLQFLLFIWGVDQSELVFFITSMLTVLGIAFFAQWSIISNVTSSFIIFFSYPSKIGDTITILDKDYPITGKISDIEIFFVTIKTEEGEIITIPNNVFIQKMIKQKKAG
ncbi:MAG: mechanosensitive ion channel domain-containing protein [Cyclobacteriaceae bacterium]